MEDRSLTFALLSISATAEKASEIEGDLIEQSHVYGKWWMRRQVLLIALILFGRALSRNLGAISLLCVPVFAAIFLSVMLSERLFVGAVGSYLVQELAFPLTVAKIAVLCLTVFPLAYLIGVGLVRSAPARTEGCGRRRTGVFGFRGRDAAVCLLPPFDDSPFSAEGSARNRARGCPAALGRPLDPKTPQPRTVNLTA